MGEQVLIVCVWNCLTIQHQRSRIHAGLDVPLACVHVVHSIVSPSRYLVVLDGLTDQVRQDWNLCRYHDVWHPPEHMVV